MASLKSLAVIMAAMCVCLAAQSRPTLCNPLACSLPDSFVRGGSPSKNTGVACHALHQGIFPTQAGIEPNQGVKLGSPALQADSLPSELSELPGRSSQGSNPTKESNWGLLDYRRILYHLSYQGCQVGHLNSLPPGVHIEFLDKMAEAI